MIEQNFKIAMTNLINIGGYHDPRLAGDPGGEWLIAKRWGDDGRFLSVSDTKLGANGPRGGFDPTNVPEGAPDELVEHQSMFGLKMTDREDDGGPIFIFSRRLQSGQSVDGKYYPVDGYVRLYMEEGEIRLRASGRHAHNEGGEDVPYPESGEGMCWHFDATQKSWSGASGV